MTTKITFNDLDQDLKDKLDATGIEIVSPGNIAKFGDTTGIATLRVPDDKDQRFLLVKDATTPSDYGTMQILRRADYTSGTSGFVGSALNVKTEARGVSNGQSEWAGLFTMESRSTQSGTWPQNVGVYSQGLKYTSSSTWAGCFEISDRNPTTSASGASIGIEVSASANGADVLATPQRNGVHIAISRGTINAQDCEWGRGFWVSAGASARWIYGFSATDSGSYAFFSKFNGVASDSATLRDESTCAVGLDLKRASYSTQAALWFKALDKIVWESNGLISTRWNSANNRWELRNGEDVKFWVDTTTGQTSVGAGDSLKYLSAKLSLAQTIPTGDNNLITFDSVGRDTTGGLVSLSGGVISISPSVAEFEVITCVQCVSAGSGITLRLDLSEFSAGLFYPNPRHSHNAQNPCAHITTGVIYNSPTGATRNLTARLDVNTASVQVDTSGASAIMVRVLSTR